MKRWLSRFRPGNWIQYPKEKVVSDPRYGLKGRLLYIILGFFVLSTATLVIEMVLYARTEMYIRSSQNNAIIFAASLAIGLGIFTKAWWTRYLAYFMFVITLSNLFIYGDVHVGWGQSVSVYFWTVFVLLLVRDLPLCLYLTASRRARLTLEHQEFRFDRARPAKTHPTASRPPLLMIEHQKIPFDRAIPAKIHPG